MGALETVQYLQKLLLKHRSIFTRLHLSLINDAKINHLQAQGLLSIERDLAEINKITIRAISILLAECEPGRF